jgi:ribosome production factor 1
MRVPDETIVNPEDEEVLADERTDEMAAYFDRKENPKILITTGHKCTLV